MKPIVKYRGGKSKEIKFFEQYFPENYDKYIEPFFGGGAVFFHIEPSQGAIINDVNDRLMTFYNDVKFNFEQLKNELLGLEETYKFNQKTYIELKAVNPEERVENKNEALYYLIRDMYNGKAESKYLPGTLYYFINKLAYSGMIRFNSNGEYNVPFGRYSNFNTSIITEQHHNLLMSSQLYCKDYSHIFDLAEPSDFMFLDPPYDCIFNDYGNLASEEGFNEAEHRRLASDFKNLSCQALMVIGKTPLTESLYKDYIVDEYDKNYAVNIRNRFKSTAKHIVVMNYRSHKNA